MFSGLPFVHLEIFTGKISMRSWYTISSSLSSKYVLTTAAADLAHCKNKFWAYCR